MTRCADRLRSPPFAEATSVAKQRSSRLSWYRRSETFAMLHTCGERSRRPGGDTYPSPLMCLVSWMRSVAIHRLDVQRIIGSSRSRHGSTRLSPSQRRHTRLPRGPHLANTSLRGVNAYALLRLKPRTPPASPKTWLDASRRTAQPVRARHGSSRRTQPEGTTSSRLAGNATLPG